MIYQIFGGALAIFVLSLLFGRILFRRFGLKKKVVSSVTVLWFNQRDFYAGVFSKKSNDNAYNLFCALFNPFC